MRNAIRDAYARRIATRNAPLQYTYVRTDGLTNDLLSPLGKNLTFSNVRDHADKHCPEGEKILAGGDHA